MQYTYMRFIEPGGDVFEMRFYPDVPCVKWLWVMFSGRPLPIADERKWIGAMHVTTLHDFHELAEKEVLASGYTVAGEVPI